MQLTLSNIGPIRSATFLLRPLTVFVGPNNSGKSFAAQVLHAMLSRNATDSAIRRMRFTRAQQNGPESAMSREEGLSEEIYEILTDRTGRDFDEVSAELKDYFSRALSQAIIHYARSLLTELERTTGAEATSLRRIQGKRRTSALIELSFPSPEWSISISITSRGTQYSSTTPDLEAAWRSINKTGWRRIYNRSNRLQGPPRSYLLREVGIELFKACITDLPIATRYLPAARSGLMQSHKVLSSSLVRQASLAGIRPMNIPAMSGVVTEFLGDLIELNPDFDGHYSRFAERLESDLLDGRVVLEQGSEETAEVLYESHGGTFPLSRTSSMVSEMAPIVLYLRNLIQRRELLFIEEPEAHLHPAAQIVLAQILIGLVNAGLRIGLTTHSEFFLQKLNNSILAATIGGKDANESGYPAENRLQPSSVAAYRFVPTRTGTIVEPLAPMSDEGIPSTSFDEVSEELYNEMATLEQRVADER